MQLCKVQLFLHVFLKLSCAAGDDRACVAQWQQVMAAGSSSQYKLCWSCCGSRQQQSIQAVLVLLRQQAAAVNTSCAGPVAAAGSGSQYKLCWSCCGSRQLRLGRREVRGGAVAVVSGRSTGVVCGGCVCRYKQTLDMGVQQRQHERWDRLVTERVQYKRVVAVSGWL